MRVFRVGVIGAGAVAQACHIPGYGKARNCRLVALADPEERCLREVARKGWRFERTYADYRQMLAREDLDVVSVCTPNSLHKDMAVAALRKGCDVLLEKPVAVTMPQARAIAAAVQASGRRLMVCFSHRFNAMNQAARKALRAGRIGKPYMARVRFAHTGPIPGWAKTDWFYKPALAGGGATLDMAIHAFDLLQYYLGPATAVQAKVATLRKKIEVDDNAVALLEFGPGCLGYVEAGWTSPAGFVGVELMGDKGCIVVDYNSGQATMMAGRTDPSGRTDLKRTVLAKNPTPQWTVQMDYATKQLARKGPFCVGIDEGVGALAVALGAYRSSRTGRRVAL